MPEKEVAIALTPEQIVEEMQNYGELRIVGYGRPEGGLYFLVVRGGSNGVR